jgi:DNA recombination protein RmuC
MHVGVWSAVTITILGFAGIVLAGLGYLLAVVKLGRQSAELAAQLTQVQQELAKASANAAELHAQLKQTESLSHQQQLAEGKLSEQLNAAQATSSRLASEVNEHKAALAVLRQQLDEAKQKHHAAEKLHESALAELRALSAQTAELRERLQTADKEAREQLLDIKAQQKVATDKHDALQARYAQLDSHYTKLKTEQDEREASHVRELASFEQQKANLVEQFKVISNDILEAKTLSLQESSKLTLNAAMSPFQQSIDSFKKEVQEIHHRETTQQGELRKELESLKALNQQITTEAHELSTALRGQKKLQGNWGELVLENVLDRSGLQLGKDYQREVSFTTEEGRQRPDAVIYLPQGKHLIVDAKVSLNAYTRYVNSEDDAERALALKDHVQAVGNRIKELADRDYYKLPGLNSPEMVFMFIPIESAFVEALKADETLFQQAIENHVLVATPTTLLTSLNIVKQLWRYEDQNKHTAALANKADAVFKKLNGFLASFEKIKKGLDGAAAAYVTAENQLVSGKGNLVKQVGDFKNLAPAIKAELPSYFVDKAALEIDFIPAELAQNLATDSDPVDETDAESEAEEN